MSHSRYYVTLEQIWAWFVGISRKRLAGGLLTAYSFLFPDITMIHLHHGYARYCLARIPSTEVIGYLYSNRTVQK